MTGQGVVEGEFDAFDSLVFNIGEAQDVGHQAAFRVEALHLSLLVEAGHAQLSHFFRDIQRDLSLDIDEGTLGVGNTGPDVGDVHLQEDRKSTRLNSSHVKISYAVFCLKKKI